MNSMDQPKTSPLAGTNASNVVSSNVDFVDALIVLARHKRLITGVTLAAAVLSVAISFALPERYAASTKLLPPQQAQSGAAALLNQLGGVAGAMAGSAGLKNPGDIYVGMLKSHRIEDRLVQRFDLKTVYETDSLEKARQRLENNTVISTGKDGFITVEVEDPSKKRVAQLANAYVEELMRLSTNFTVTEAGQRRAFYEQQLELTKNKLSEAEVDLKHAIEKRGVVSVDTDSRAIVETGARLRAQISAKEIQLNSLRAFVTENNVEFARAQQDLISLRGELSRLENGQTGGTDEKSVEKSQGLESVKLLREVKYRQMLYELLAKQYELARLDEAKDLSSLQILDLAVEPERRAKPKRAFIVIGGTLFGFLLGMGAAFALETRRRAGVENNRKWSELKSLLRK